MTDLCRIAILGLYNSGSTALAGALHRLGVHMGAPFWYSSDERAKNNFYEPWDLACQLRVWWNEPNIRENTARPIRISCLGNWVRLRQCFYQAAVGAKHPLLCLCGDDLVTAWGTDTIFLRACRYLLIHLTQMASHFIAARSAEHDHLRGTRRPIELRTREIIARVFLKHPMETGAAAPNDDTPPAADDRRSPPATAASRCSDTGGCW